VAERRGMLIPDALSAPGLAMPRLEIVTRLRNLVVIAVVALYFLLNVPFMQVRFPPVVGGGVPVGEIVLILALVTVNYTATLGRLALTIGIIPLLLWWLFGIGRALIDFHTHGIWALRDAVHVIESLYLLVAFAVASRPELLERLFRLLPVLLTLGVLYALTIPIRPTLIEISPTVLTGIGLEMPLLGMYSNTPRVVMAAVAWLILFHGRKPLANLAAILLLGYVLFLFQQRTIYLTIIAVLAFVVLYQRSQIGRAFLAVYVLLLAAAAMPVLGIELRGRLGEAASLEFLGQHFLAIFGIAPEAGGVVESAARGVDLRIGWWRDIYREMIADPIKLMTGLGFGIPLTDMGTFGGMPVREPHNSYVSVVARMGLVGAVA
jgi:hypothetical protein